MSGAGQKAPDWGAFWRFGVSLKGLSSVRRDRAQIHA